MPFFSGTFSRSLASIYTLLQPWLIGYCLGIFVFFVLRIALYLSNADFFSALTPQEILTAFLIGLRFDVSIISIFTIIPLLIAYFPLKLFRAPFIQKLLLLSIFISIGYFIFISILDILNILQALILQSSIDCCF